MIRTILYILLLSVCTVVLKAQDMTVIFTDMPDRIIPQLEQAWRKDLISLFKDGKEARLKNNWEGTSQLLALTDDYLKLRSTERTVIEMKRLPLINNTYIICFVKTVEGPAPDSSVDFYTTDWKLLDRANLFVPLPCEAFFREDVDRLSDAYLDAVALVDMDLIHYSLSPDNDNLEATYSTLLYLSPEIRAKVIPFVKTGGPVYFWNRSRYSN